MANTNRSDFINKFKIRNFFPFYIENINNQFFSTVKKTNKNLFTRNKFQNFISDLDKEEMEKFNDSQAILDHDNIQSLLNQIVWKIVAKTGNNKYDLFLADGHTNYGHPQYVKEKNEFYDLKILGNVYSDKRYIYSIEIDPESYLYDFVEQIQIAFFIDEKNKTITGGFSLNLGQDKLLNSFDEIIRKMYMNSLIKNFVHRELSPLSVNNFLSIIDLYDEIKIDGQNEVHDITKINKKSILDLKKEWKDFLNEKIFTNKSNFIVDKQLYENQLFYATLNVFLSCLTIYEELKKYFSSKEPELFLPLFKRVEYVKVNDDQTYEQDLYELIHLLKNRYFYFKKDNKKSLKKIKSAEDAIEALIKIDQMENVSFGNISTSYELTRNIDIPFLDEDDDVFMNSKELKIIYLLIFNPSVLGMNYLSLDFLKYDNFYKNISTINIDDSWNELLDTTIDKTICEWNYDYVSFIDQNFSNLIIKNDNPIKKNIGNDQEIKYEIDPNKKIYDNYLWSFIYTKTLMWRLTDIEENMKIDKIERPWKLRDYLNQLELLRLDWHDTFYGITQVKIIVKKIDSFFNFNSLNKILKEKITKEDKLYGKGKERKNLAAAFVSAGIFGLLDFFTMVYSVLTVQNSDNKLTPVNIAIISIGSIFAICLFAILMYKMFSPLISKKKNKQYY